MIASRSPLLDPDNVIDIVLYLTFLLLWLLSVFHLPFPSTEYHAYWVQVWQSAKEKANFCLFILQAAEAEAKKTGKKVEVVDISQESSRQARIDRIQCMVEKTLKIFLK